MQIIHYGTFVGRVPESSQSQRFSGFPTEKSWRARFDVAAKKRHRTTVNGMATKKQKPSTLQRTLYAMMIDGYVEKPGAETFDLTINIPGQGVYEKTYRAEIDDDTEEGKELAPFFGGTIPDTVDLSALKGRRGFVLLGPKRASGGRIEVSVGPLLPEEAILNAASQIKMTTQKAP